jgi:hypothetical protein
MVAGTSKRGLLVRVGKDQHFDALARPGAKPYATCTMGAFEAEAEAQLEQAHRQAGLTNSNWQAVFQRTMRELDREPARFHGYLLVVTMLQRLLLSLNTLRTIGIQPELTLPEGKRFAGDLTLELERLGDALESGTRLASSQELGKALDALRGAMARTASGASLRPTVIARIAQQVVTLVSRLPRSSKTAVVSRWHRRQHRKRDGPISCRGPAVVIMPFWCASTLQSPRRARTLTGAFARPHSVGFGSFPAVPGDQRRGRSTSIKRTPTPRTRATYPAIRHPPAG